MEREREWEKREKESGCWLGFLVLPFWEEMETDRRSVSFVGVAEVHVTSQRGSPFFTHWRWPSYKWFNIFLFQFIYRLWFFSFPFFSFFQVNSNMDLLKVYPSIFIPVFKGVSKLITNIGVLEFGLGPVLSVNISQLLITSRNRSRSSILNRRLTLFFTPILSDSCPNWDMHSLLSTNTLV